MKTIEFHLDECVLQLPVGFVDKSVQMLEWTLEADQRLVLVMQREILPEGTDVDGYVDAETKDYPSRFLGYREVADEEGRWEGLAIRRKAFRFSKEGDVFYNHQAFLFDGGRLLVLTASARAQHRDAVDEVVRAAIEGMRLRDG